MKSHGKHVEETAPYLLNIVRFLDIHLGVQFKEMIGDFIKDESGTWWLVNVKGFLIQSMTEEIDIRKIVNFGDSEFKTYQIASK